MRIKYFFLIIVINCFFKTNGETILLDCSMGLQAEYNAAIIEYVVLNNITDSTFESMIREEKRKNLGLCINLGIHGIRQILVTGNTTLTVKEIADISESLYKQNYYPWIIDCDYQTMQPSFSKAAYCKLFENTDNREDKYQVRSITCGQFFRTPHSHNCILWNNKYLSKISRQEMIQDTKDFIEIILNVNDNLIKEKGIRETEYPKYFSDNYLKSYYELKPRIYIMSP